MAGTADRESMTAKGSVRAHIRDSGQFPTGAKNALSHCRCRGYDADTETVCTPCAHCRLCVNALKFRPLRKERPPTFKGYRGGIQRYSTSCLTSSEQFKHGLTP